MNFSARVGKHSFVYTVANVFQKGTAFLLLPLYTRCLTPHDYGTISVVGAVNALLVVLFTVSLQGAFTRFYFDYRDNPLLLREFWGTLITFVVGLSLAGGVVFLGLGRFVLKPIIGDIPFWPFAALGVMTSIFQPVSVLFLSLLQTTEQSKRYSIYGFIQFTFNLGLTLVFVVYGRRGALGVLTTSLITSVLFYGFYLWRLRAEVRYGLEVKHLKPALRYSLPLVPHLLAAQVQIMADRFFLNWMINTQTAGLYNIGFLLGSVLTIVIESVNRAFVPAAMGALNSGIKGRTEDIRLLGRALVVLYCLLATGISIFSKELIGFFTAPSYHPSFVVVPYVSFGFVFSGVYYLFVNTLFYNMHLTRHVVWGTMAGVFSSLAFNACLIPSLGLRGAAVSSMLSQFVCMVVVAFIGMKHDTVQWDYGRIATCVAVSLGVGVTVVEFPWPEGSSTLVAKPIIFIGHVLLIGAIAWDNPMQLPRFVKKLVKGEFSDHE